MVARWQTSPEVRWANSDAKQSLKLPHALGSCILVVGRLSAQCRCCDLSLSQCELDHTPVVVPSTTFALLNSQPYAEGEMATNQTHSGNDRLTHPLLEELGAATPQAEIFVYSVKIVCGKQTETHCCCVSGARPGVYATEVNIQNIGLQPTRVAKGFFPLINSGAVVGREPNIATVRAVDKVLTLPPFGATMDDCCRIAELLLGAPPSGETGLTIGYLTILSLGAELAVSAVYTANPLSADGISIDVEYIPSRRLGRPGPD